ncbi:MAG TPA: radical SAM protein [Edaphobacter sp.]|nr:radical SAM protein [Edaphobacter sp.]
MHSQCNCRCVMCDIWKRKDGREYHAADLERHRESIRTLGVKHVVLTGGEPLLNRELDAICDFFRDLGLRITLLTTGLLLQKKADIVARGFDDIILSIDGPPDVHDRIRRVPGAFQTIQKGVLEVRARRPRIPISCRTTVQKLNHTHLRATVSAARSLGLDSISFLAADISSAAFNREERWAPERQNEIALGRAELVALEEEIELLIQIHQEDIDQGFIAESNAKLRRIGTRFREHIDGTPPKAPLCNAPWVSAVIEVDGSVRPCFFHPSIGNAHQLTLEEAINTETALSFRSGLKIASNPTCQRCVCSLNYAP